jgi:hypothetical protein
MDVKQLKLINASPALDDSGQSMLEFLFMLPLMLALTVLLVRVNTSIQMSIVNQKYTRGQAQWFVFISPIYPQRVSPDGQDFRKSNFIDPNYNQMIIGVSEEPPSEANQYNISASTQMVVRNPTLSQPSPEQSEADQLSIVRIRNTLSLCTQSNVIQGSRGPVTAGLEGAKLAKPSIAEGITQASFLLCQAPIINEEGELL